jgi:head-tail adaptor
MSELAGKLRERVTVASPSEARGPAGEAGVDFMEGDPVWASVEPVREAPTVGAERRTQRPRYRVTLRGEIGVKPGDRLVWRGETLSVLAVTRDPARPERMTATAERLE